MCDYVYLDGLNDVSSDNTTVSFNIDERRFKHKKINNKVFMSVEQVQFRGYINSNYNTNACELVSNIQMVNYYNTSGLKTIMQIDAIYSDATGLLKSSACTNNYDMKYEINIQNEISFRIRYLNEYVALTGAYFKLLLKFEYEDIN